MSSSSRAGRARDRRPAKKCWLILVGYRVAEYVRGFEGLVEPEQDKQQDDRQQPESAKLNRFPEGQLVWPGPVYLDGVAVGRFPLRLNSI